MEHVLTPKRQQSYVGYRMQTSWGPMEAAIWTIECGGAGLFLASAIWGELLVGMAAGVAMVAVAIVLLLVHLGQPRNAWRAVARLNRSWISRGTLALGGFAALGGIYVLARISGASPEAIPVLALRWLLVANAAFILVYPGLVMSASRAIPFWTRGFMPALSLANGAASGLALFLLSAQWNALPSVREASTVWLCGSLIGLGVLVFLQFIAMRWEGRAAAASVAYVMQHRILFWGVACIVGVVVPLLLAGWISDHAGMIALIVLCRLAGDCALRTVLLRAGFYAKLV